MRWGSRLAGSEAFAVLGGRPFAAQRGLRLCEHHAYGRAQFVRGVGGELHLPVESGLQPTESIVEYACKLAQLAVCVCGVNALGEVACGDFGSSDADVPNGTQRACGNPPTAGQSEHEYGDTRPGKEPSESPYLRQFRPMFRPTRMQSPKGM